MATKKKPYSRIENAKLLRGLAFTLRRERKALEKDKAPEWFVRLNDEHAHLMEDIIRLGDFLFVQAVKDGDTVRSPEALATGKKNVVLLDRQLKAMKALEQVIEARLDLGWTPEA